LDSFKRQINEGHPEKIVIVSGPTFGTAMEFMLLGVAIGAAAMYWKTQRSEASAGASAASASAASAGAVFEGLSGGGAKPAQDASQIVDRLTQLSKRLKSLAARTKETVQSAAEVVGPSIKQAVEEGKTVAHQTERDLEVELQKPATATVTVPDGPVPGM